MSTPKSIIIHGRRWFQRSNGNTYHTTQIFLNGKLIGSTPIRYGYGDQYLYTAFEWLGESVFIQLNTLDGPTEPPWAYCKRVGCHLEYFATDVGRKADL